MKHKHTELIHAWADGAEIQYRPVPEYGEWKDEPRHLIWDNLAEYRIKPAQDGSLINEGTKTKQGKPVGKFAKFTDGIWREVTDGSAGVLLYITPQECDECGVGGGYALYCLACAEKYVKPEWIGLTHEEISVEWFAVFDAEPGIGKNITNGVFDFANAIEAKLKKKNAL